MLDLFGPLKKKMAWSYNQGGGGVDATTLDSLEILDNLVPSFFSVDLFLDERDRRNDFTVRTTRRNCQRVFKRWSSKIMLTLTAHPQGLHL